MSELKEIAAKAAEDLPSAFLWSDTPQGHAYWAEVRLDLRTLAELEDDELYPPGFESELQGTAPLGHEDDRKLASELADLIWDLQKHREEDGLRWIQVHDELRALAGDL